MHIIWKIKISVVITLTGFLFALPIYAGDTSETATDNEVCDSQVDNGDPLQAATCTCDDAHDYLEDYLENKPEPRKTAEIDRLVDTLDSACPCEMDSERDVPVGLRLLEVLVNNGIPFGTSLDSVARVCDLRAQGIAALNQAFSPGVSQRSGGPGGEVSPH